MNRLRAAYGGACAGHKFEGNFGTGRAAICGNAGKQGLVSRQGRQIEVPLKKPRRARILTKDLFQNIIDTGKRKHVNSTFHCGNCIGKGNKGQLVS